MDFRADRGGKNPDSGTEGVVDEIEMSQKLPGILTDEMCGSAGCRCGSGQKKD